MGTGKTTLGRALHGSSTAGGVSLRFVDLDREVEHRAGMTIPEIFKSKGEPYFRNLETQVLRSVAFEKDIVIACGGGTPCHSSNMQWMNAHGLTVVLRASAQVLHRRLTEESFGRPLIQGLSSEALSQFIATKQAEREPYYGQARIEFQSDMLENAQEIEQSRRQFLRIVNNLIQP